MTYTTIPVKREIKERLEKFKGEREWSSFLNDLINEVIRVRREEHKASQLAGYRDQGR